MASHNVHRATTLASPFLKQTPTLAKMPSSFSFNLTKAHIHTSFAPLAETADLALRNTFFTQTLHPDARITLNTPASSLGGTYSGVQEFLAGTMAVLGKRLVGPIKFTVTHVFVDAEEAEEGGRWATIETKGEAVRKSGKRYDNEYVWVTRWDDEGRIVEMRNYFDTKLAEEVLEEPAD